MIEGKAGMVGVTEAAFIIGCGRAAVLRLVRAGKLIEKDRVGKAKLFYRSDAEKLAGTLKQYPSTGRCGMCDRPFDGTEEPWGPLRAEVHAACRSRLETRLAEVHGDRYCTLCGGSKVADVGGPVVCLCVGTLKEKV